MRARVAWVAIWMLAVWPLVTSSVGQNRVDIVDIYRRFLSSRFAALGCHATSDATEQRFLSNLFTVSIRAAMALKDRNPNLTDAQLAARMDEAQKHIREVIDGEISKNGCNSALIQEQLALYKIHSEMSL